MLQNCPKCHSQNFRKDGIVKNKQRYFCKDCQHHFSVLHVGKPDFIKQSALILLQLGFNAREIAKLLNISHVSVHNWLKQQQKNKTKKLSVKQIEPNSIRILKYYRKQAKLNNQYHFLLIPLARNFDNKIIYFRKNKQSGNDNS